MHLKNSLSVQIRLNRDSTRKRVFGVHDYTRCAAPLQSIESHTRGTLSSKPFNLGTLDARTRGCYFNTEKRNVISNRDSADLNWSLNFDQTHPLFFTISIPLHDRKKKEFLLHLKCRKSTHPRCRAPKPTRTLA